MRFIPFILLFFIAFNADAQLPISLELHKKFQEVGDNEDVPVIIQGNQEQIAAFMQELKQKPIFEVGNITRINLSKNDLKNANAEDFNIRISGGLKGQLLNDSVRVLNGAVPLHEGLGDLPQKYKGKGVVIGILDSGIDYRHEDFNDDDGNSRIYSIWDQRKTGNAPTGFDYGYLCDAASIADGSCPSFDEEWTSWIAHGTHVAGTAAGYDKANDNQYTGMAPEATIIAVALDFENFSTAVIDGTKYVYEQAQQLGMPVVINLSAGVYSGPHDGKNLITYAVNEMITEQPGRAFVAAGGNAGAVRFHSRHFVNDQPQFTYFRNRGSGANLRFEWHMYADSLDLEGVNFKIQADKRNTLEKLGESQTLNILADFEDPGNGVIEKEVQVLSESGDVLGDAVFYVEKFEKRYGIRVYITNSSNQYYWRFSSWGSGLVDIYAGSLTRTSVMVRADQLPTSFAELPFYTTPDLNQNMVGYFSASRNTITVGAYISKNQYIRYDDELYIDQGAVLYDKLGGSSIGPNRDGYLKPDIASTGSRVASASNQDYIQFRIQNNQHLNSVTKDERHFYLRGTSMSAPSVAGGIALLLQENPDLTWDEILKSVNQNAVKDEFTGDTNNPAWGHGKFSAIDSFEGVVRYGCTDSAADNFDAKATVDDNSCKYLGCTDPNAINYSAIATIDNGSCIFPNDGKEFHFSVTPNPLTSTGQITYAFNNLPNATSIVIYNTLGQRVWNMDINTAVGQMPIDKSQFLLADQMYFVVLMSGDTTLETQKLMLQ